MSRSMKDRLRVVEASTRKNLLEILEECTTETTVDPEEWGIIIRTLLLSGISAATIATKFGVNRSTVTDRWAEGLNVPQSYIRSAAVAGLVELLKEKSEAA